MVCNQSAWDDMVLTNAGIRLKRFFLFFPCGIFVKLSGEFLPDDCTRAGDFHTNSPVAAGRYQNEWTRYRDQRRKTWLMIPLHSLMSVPDTSPISPSIRSRETVAILSNRMTDDTLRPVAGKSG